MYDMQKHVQIQCKHKNEQTVTKKQTNYEQTKQPFCVYTTTM